MSARPRLIVATRNAHKTAEIRAMLAASHEVLDMSAFPEAPAIDETGVTFLENARLKALGISRVIEGIVLSDDSGLEVDALHGAPGVWSSSFGGVEGDHARNNARLLREMAGKTDRAARFRCTMVLAQGGEELAHFTGVVEGRIIGEPRGTEGFGYDPLFMPDGHERTFAELGADVKNSLSHRARALAQMVEWLDGKGSVGSLPGMAAGDARVPPASSS
ncbi:MAG: RdgB/HAM1 family non-canonical purine NTP pyrophosphatase [Luteolibacter sp.]